MISCAILVADEQVLFISNKAAVTPKLLIDTRSLRQSSTLFGWWEPLMLDCPFCGSGTE